jgi:hypothetical protein
MMTEKYEVGDLVYYSSVEGIKIALITKVKKLLKLYDILIQTENVYMKNVHISYLQKAV